MTDTHPMVARVGITRAAARGKRTTYSFVGRDGLAQIANGTSLSSPDPASFRARVVSVPLEQIGCEEIAATAHRVERSPADIVSAPLDVVRVSCLREGRLTVTSDEGTITAGPGDVVAIHMDTPFVAVFDGVNRHAGALLPTRLLRLPVAWPPPARHRVVRPSAMTAAFRALVQSLIQEAPADNTRDSELVAHAVVDVAQGVLGADVPRGSREDEDRRRIYDMVEREHADPRLRVTTIAARLAMSVRHVHRLFADEPESVSQVIRRRRVEAVRDELIMTRDAFEDIARRAGFGSDDTAYRSFREVAGVTPAEHRRRHARL